MSTLVLVLLILILLGVFPAWNYGGPYAGGGLGLVVVILLVLVLLGHL